MIGRPPRKPDPRDACPRCHYGPLMLNRKPPRKKCPACHLVFATTSPT